MSQQAVQNEPSPNPPRPRRSRVWKWVRRTFIWTVLLLVCIILLFQWQPVQDWLARQATNSISKTLETRVTVGKARLSWLDQLRIEDVFIEDKYGDTLLYGKTLEANFNIFNGLEIEGILIEDTRFQIRRDLGDPESNLTTALGKLFSKESESSSTPLNLKLKRVDLHRIAFIQNDSVKGQRFDVSLESGVVRMDELDLPNGEVRIASAELREPLVRQTSIVPSPIDPALLKLDSITQDTSQQSLRFLAGSIEVIDGGYQLDNFRKEPIQTGDITAVDFARLGVFDIDLELIEVDFFDGDFLAKLKHLSLEERSGFVLDRLSVQDLKITPTELQLYDLELVTEESELSDSLQFNFRNGWGSWADFNNEVRMDIKVKNSQVAVRDLLYFARKLRFNTFFRDNLGRKLTLGGRLSGRVNNLRGRDVEISLDNSTSLVGSFGSRNLAKRGSESLNLDLKRLTTNMNTLRRLIPDFSPPENFDRLGTLQFKGSFDGFFTDFFASGDLRTDIGQTIFNMALVINDNAPATYNGQLALNDFDLGVWANNPDFGIVNFSGAIENGIGLEAASARADLDATIQDFNFRGYTYANAVIDGRLEEKFFNGNFQIADENIDLNFLGELDFRDSIPTFDFDATVGELDLLALNLSKKPIALSGGIDLNLVGTNFSEMEGRVELSDFEVLIDTLAVDIDTLLAYSTFDAEGQKVVKLESDIATGEIVGRFDLEEVPASLTNYLVNYYPAWVGRLKIKPPRNVPPPNRFSFDLQILDSKGLNRLISPQLGRIVDVSLNGSYDGFEDELQAEFIAPNLNFADFRFVDFVLKSKGEKDEGELDFSVDSTFVNGRPLLNRLTLLSLVDNELIDFGITYGGDPDNIFLDRINLDGQLSLPDSQNFELRFDASQLEIFQQRWQISRGNYVIFGPRLIDAQNFALRSGRRSIRLNNFGEDGLNLDLLNMDLALIDSVWNYPPLDFSGDVDINISVADVFRQEGISAQIRSDTFLMNNEDYGYLRVDVSAPNPRSQLTAYMNLNRDTAQLIAEATFNLADLVESDPLPKQQKNYLDLNVGINGYPLDLAKYWVGGSVSDITGEFNAKLNVKGPVKKLDVDGYIDALGGAFTLDYLQTRYRFYQSRVNINNTLFDLTGTRLIDRFGNGAELSGGMTHNRLKNLGLDARITTNRFLALDLAPGQNPNFFGTAIGSGLVTFTGNFQQTDIYVSAKVGRDSKLSIPVSYGSEAGPIDNVRFVNRSIYTEETKQEKSTTPTGVSLKMDLVVTDEAIGEIIFDEEVGDILRGQGNGNLQLNIPRDGDMEMFGTYNITGGDYLFTFQKIINKEFSVRPGGTVRWTGDPFEATLDVSADYENLETPILPFIQEYLVTAPQELTDFAANATEIDLTLELDGLLSKPNINFDIGFPNLTGQLESYANNKRRLLLLDQNELNRQVFGLIVAGQFLPSDLSFGISDAAINTLSEWLSNYLSLLLNDLVRNAFGEDAFISSIEFDLAYNSYRNSSLSTNNDGRSSALEFSFRRDFNNRLSIQGDVNVLNNNQLTSLGNSGTFIGNNLALEYVLNDARTLKVRLYQRLEPDIASGRRIQGGVGLSWRREFDTLKEFFRSFKKDSERQTRNN
ncbi:translocation/assembly module TamB domain-containing protein [Neolewinella agarilytica]|uniref:Autotransporter translocation and assembly factor TamB n=1 Tax=Neolewinella agarilytica TaxID=478744 RepID=A0A1H9LR36_9BACT|nr:translocation/assembly module TamB domain-containing protein [Neolewinella agarilytica]SER13677.1 Autotransporter translocation and assembly factor TamB [Neolewinella agarilytica]